MTFEEALRKVLRTYWNDNDEFEKMSFGKGNRKYSKQYFDGIEESILGQKPTVEKGSKKNG